MAEQKGQKKIKQTGNYCESKQLTITSITLLFHWMWKNLIFFIIQKHLVLQHFSFYPLVCTGWHEYIYIITTYMWTLLAPNLWI